MIAIPLQSGSNGNCIYVEAGGTAVLLDAGIPARRARERLAALGRDVRDVDAVVISHDHVDHVRYAGVFHRAFHLPIYATAGTIARADAKMDLGPITDLRLFRPGQTLRIGALRVQTIPTPHDGIDGVAFVVSAGCLRLGVLTDLGHVFEGLVEVVASLDGVIVESNYDPDMLVHGPYPAQLKERIRGPRGHLSNEECADLLRAAWTGRLQWACCAHLSETNNHPDVVRSVHRMVLRDEVPLFIASRYGASKPLRLAP